MDLVHSMLPLTKFVSFARHWHDRLSAFRMPLGVCAALLFCGGAYWSFHQMRINAADLKLGPLIMLTCISLPSLLHAGIGLFLLARGAGLTIPPGRAMVIAAYAYLAEILPIPGGAIVRTRALMKAGGSLQHSSALVVLTAILWISIALIGAGLALLHTEMRLALPALLFGIVLIVPAFGWLWITATAAIAMQTLLHRIVGMVLVTARLQLAFAVFYTPIYFSEALPFALASIIGSASSIAPAGLGVSESLAALIATTSAYPPTVAFLAVGIDRLLYLLACGCVVLVAQLHQILERGRVGIFKQ